MHPLCTGRSIGEKRLDSAGDLAALCPRHVRHEVMDVCGRHADMLCKNIHHRQNGSAWPLSLPEGTTFTRPAPAAAGFLSLQAPRHSCSVLAVCRGHLRRAFTLSAPYAKYEPSNLSIAAQFPHGPVTWLMHDASPSRSEPCGHGW
jgi:hypothetical protein